MLRCLELKQPINKFIRKWRGTDNDEEDVRIPGNAALSNTITDDEWDEAARLVQFLERFYQMTKRMEGNGDRGSLWMTIINLQVLYQQLLKLQDEYRCEPDCFLKGGVEYGLQKLLTYWEYIILNPPVSPYAIATILNPKFRMLWFQDKWRNHPIWYKKVTASMKTVFQRYVDEAAAAEALDEPEQEPESPSRRKTPSGEYHDALYDEVCEVDTSLMTGNHKAHKKQRLTSELQKYYDSVGEDIKKAKATPGSVMLQDPLAWWLEVGRYSYPLLFKIALDYLSIPCTSCECERAFSGGRRTVSWDRSKLSGATIEAIQLQKNWLRRGVVNSELNGLANYITTVRSSPEESLNQQASTSSVT